MFGRVLIVGFICFLVAVGIAMFLAPALNPGVEEVLPICPYIESVEIEELQPEIRSVVNAYEAIRETLEHDSLENVGMHSAVLIKYFNAHDPKTASLAKRLGAEKDVESARRVFFRMSRTMQKQVRKKAVM